jgi:hypothetical protein
MDSPRVAPSVRRRGSEARRLHLLLAGGLVLCVGAFIVELLRALGGHSFSWMYVVEWPLFAGFGIYMWWTLLQGKDRAPNVPSPGSADQSTAVPDEGLDAWNLYLQVMESDQGQDESERRQS